MRLYVRGKSESISPEETRYAVKWACEQLMGPRLCKNVTIRLEWKKYPGEKGHCDWRDRNHKPRNYDIAVSPALRRPSALLTLFHECAHVAQYATGRLMSYMSNSRFSRWKKTAVDEERVPYERLPWELEADKLERKLYVAYARHISEEGLWKK